MKRITDHRLDVELEECEFPKEFVVEIYRSLRKYEDLGFTPEEIKEIIFNQKDKGFSEEAIELAFKSGIEIGRCVERR